MTIPVPPKLPVPPVREMSATDLADLIRSGGPYRGKAVFELADRAATDDAAANLLGELTHLPMLRDDRIHAISLAWAAIVSLLAARTPHARQVAYRSFAALPGSEQEGLLAYLRCSRIEDAQP
ncbi:hypothetical protein [Actinoplanes siamensis]|uniref:Uncharacterized protein n=1 Tax=Actinoplanes siamensis TaxID=1223317 RepID=A0A919TQ53_9ACTN|nr:hypothetical protein [Actinoplanes siamensis]GIF09773.1 hypothetical protein Asi03nite_73110 [Actinoplanes siamensis]